MRKLALLSLLLGFAAASSIAAEILPLSEVKKGMRGYGVTVFEGSELERFDVEILGVLHNVGPGQSLILARVDSPVIARSGVIAGMSGSPIYIDGKVIGALAYSWQFAKEPITGITPIEDMLKLASAAPAAPASAPAFTAGELLSALASREYDSLAEKMFARFGRSASAISGASPVAMPLSFSGFSRESIDRWAVQLDAAGFIPVATGAASPAKTDIAPRRFEPGDPIAGVLVDGDLSIAATGTVTYVDGDKVYGFGHPFLDMGPVAFPMAHAEIVAVMPNLARSFKFSNTGATVGSFRHDRAAGVLGYLDDNAEMIPVIVRLDGSQGSKEYRFRVVRDAQLFPLLLAMAADNVVSSAQRAAGPRTVTLDSEIDVEGFAPIQLKDGWSGAQAKQSIPAYLAVVAGYLMSNEFANAPVNAVTLHLRDDDRIRTAKLIEASVESPSDGAWNPGDTVRVHARLKPYRGDEFVETFEVKIPADIAPGKAHIFVGSGSDANRLNFSLVPPDPRNLGHVVGVIQRLRASTDLMVALYAGAEGAVVSGVYLPKLPVSMQSVKRGGTGGPLPVKFYAASESARSLDYIVDGAMRIDLEIRHKL
jgi:hypothetical protein